MPRRHTFTSIAILLVISSTGRGQSFEIDTLSLLTDPQVQPQTLTDGVWTVTPPPGKGLFLLPIRVPGKLTEPVGFEKIAPKVAAGQFVAWYIPAAKQNTQQQGGVGVGNLGGDNGQAVNLAPPRLSKQGEFKPDGTVTWKMTRAIVGGTLKDPKQIYAMALDRKLVPAQPRQPPAGQDSTVYRQALAARTRLLAILKDLPDEFTEPAPPIIYGVFYVSTASPRFGFVGDDPLPWSGTPEQFKSLRDMTGQFDPKAAHPLFSELLKGDNRFALRLAAAVLAANNNLSKVDDNSLLMPLIEKMVSEGGAETRRMLVESVMSSTQPTPVAGPMLEKVMADADPAVAFTALQARANDQGRKREPMKTEALRTFGLTAARLLGDAHAPPPSWILRPVSEVARQSPETLQLLAGGLRVESASPERLAATIAAILAAARQRDPLAVRLLDRQLLNPSSPAVASATLQLIAATPIVTTPANPNVPVGGFNIQASPVEERPEPRAGVGLVWDIVDKLAGREESPAPPPAAVPPGFGPTPGQPQTPQNTEPDQPYPLDSSRHNLMLLLASGDESIRNFAWAALPRFVIGSIDSRSTGQNMSDVFLALADAAASVDPAPIQVVAFFDAQPDRAAAGQAMQRLLGKAKGPVRMSALLAVAATGAQAVTDALKAMTPDQRTDIATMWYSTSASSDQGDSGPPAVVGLLRPDQGANEAGKMSQWFAQQVAAGTRPRPAEWFAATREDLLLRGLGDPDDLYARACAAALVGGFMPPDDPSIQKVREKGGKIISDAPNSDEALKQIQLEWPLLRDKIIQDRLTAASGKYNLTLRITPPTTGEKLPDPTKRKPVKHDLGTIDLDARDKAKPAFLPKIDTAIVDRPLGLKVPNPIQLMELPAAKELGLKDKGELPNNGFDLTLDARGRWVGSAVLADRRDVRVILTPAP